MERFNAVFHWIRGHEVYWYVSEDELCPGDIVCETCNQIIWCRSHDPWRKKVT